MEELLSTITDESQRLFMVGIAVVVILAIALVIVIFASKIKSLKDYIFDAKEIDLSKNDEIKKLQDDLSSKKKLETILKDELKEFNDTKILLKSKEDTIFKMQERINLLEESDTLHIQKLKELTEDFETLRLKHVGLQKRNETLVESNSKIHTDYNKMHLKTSQQERRIFEKLTGDDSKQREEVENLANMVFEKNDQIFSSLEHEAVVSLLSPAMDDINSYQKEVVLGREQCVGRRRDLQRDIVSHTALYQNLQEDIKILYEKLQDSGDAAQIGMSVTQYLLEKVGISGDKFVDIKSDGDSKEGADVVVALPNDQSLMIDASFSLDTYEAYCSSDSKSEIDRKLSLYVESIQSHIDMLGEKIKKLADGSYCWMLIADDEALKLALKEENLLYSQAFSKRIVLIDPTMLLASLQGVTMLWDYQYQYAQADKLASKAQELHGQLSSLGEEMSSASKRLQMIQESLQSNSGDSD